MTFLTDLQFVLNPLTAFGMILVLGVLGGHIAQRSVHLPAMTGYLLTGLIVGPYGLNLISQEVITETEFFVELALGLALFELGRRVDFYWLRRERALLLTTLGGSVGMYAAVYGLLILNGLSIEAALAIAAIVQATSAPVLLEIIRENRAEGQVSERMVVCAGLNNIFALLMFALALAFAHFRSQGGVELALLYPAWLLLGSALIGLIAGLLAIRLNQWLGASRQEAQEVLLFSIIALTVGLSTIMQCLPGLALLIFGLSTRNLRRGYIVCDPNLPRHSLIFFVALFVVVGSRLDLTQLFDTFYLALSLVTLRALLQMMSWYLCAQPNSLSHKQGALVGLSLMPMSGHVAPLLAITLAWLPMISAEINSLMIGILCLTELIGPILTHRVLAFAHESKEA